MKTTILKGIAIALALVIVASPGLGEYTGGDEGGIGGTGIIAGRAIDEEGGIGGTGIVGVISDFGSIVVNDVHIDYDPAMPLHEAAGDGADASRLRLGQVVEVVAARSGERYRAIRMRRHVALVGPVTGFDPDNGLLEVMGQRVVLGDDTFIGDMSPVVGRRLEVSGLWDGRTLRATRIDSPRTDHDLVAGPVHGRVGSTLLVGDLAVRDVARVSDEQALDPGTLVSALGKARNGWFDGERVEIRPANPFGRHVRTVIAEGYVQQDAHGFHVGGIRVRGGDLGIGQRAVINGEVGTDRVIAVTASRNASPLPASSRSQRWPAGSGTTGHSGSGSSKHRSSNGRSDQRYPGQQPFPAVNGNGYRSPGQGRGSGGGRR